MEKVLKNKGKALVGAILFGIAVIGSAFIGKTDSNTVGSKAKKVVTAPDYLVNKGASFSPRTSVNIPDNCDDPNAKHCVYVPTTAGMTNIPTQTSYTAAEIETYLAEEWLEPHPSSGLALYTN